MVAQDKRHLMQNLFGDQSEEEEEEVESEHESNRQPDYASDEAEIGLKPEAEEVVEGQGEADVGSDVELHETINNDHIESEGERDQNSQELDLGDQRDESEGNDSRSLSESERSEQNHHVRNPDEEIDHATTPRSPDEERDEAHISKTAPELCEVFGESDEEEEAAAAEYNAVQNHSHLQNNTNISPMDDEGYEKELRPEDMLADEEGGYYSEEDNKIKIKEKERPLGPPLELGIPLRPPPSHPEKMNMIKVSNIMGIDPKPFDPKKFIEDDPFVSDESGHNKRIRLENNIVRHRAVRNPDGTKSYESNARFIRWSDGSLQLQIGNEVLDISVQDAQHDQAHLFLRHQKGILQSQGRVLRKMRFIPSSLSSNSHKLLTALVDSRHKKVLRVKNCVTAIDPEREKEQKEKAESQTIRANELLSRKKEKVNRKYTHSVRRERQLSPGFLEDALDEEDESDYYEPRRSSTARRHFEEDMEMEARAEKRIINAKKSQGYNRDIGRKTSMKSSSRRAVDDYEESEREESEYETEQEEEEEEEEDTRGEAYDDDEEPLGNEDEPKLKRKEMDSDEELESPPRKKAATSHSHRRKALVYDSDED